MKIHESSELLCFSYCNLSSRTLKSPPKKENLVVKPPEIQKSKSTTLNHLSQSLLPEVLISES